MPYKISEKVIDSINTPYVRHALAGELSITEQTIIRHIKRNDWNGPLTTYGAMLVITKCLKTDFSNILEASNQK